jgi:hypothetical protein
MRKLVAAATALSLLALSLPIAASAQSTKPAVGSTAPAQTAPTSGPAAANAKTTLNARVVKPAKHHHAKRHHRTHFAKRHHLHRLAAYKTHRKHHAAKRQHHARHHRAHAKHVASTS